MHVNLYLCLAVLILWTGNISGGATFYFRDPDAVYRRRHSSSHISPRGKRLTQEERCQWLSNRPNIVKRRSVKMQRRYRNDPCNITSVSTSQQPEVSNTGSETPTSTAAPSTTPVPTSPAATFLQPVTEQQTTPATTVAEVTTPAVALSTSGTTADTIQHKSDSKGDAITDTGGLTEADCAQVDIDVHDAFQNITEHLPLCPAKAGRQVDTSRLKDSKESKQDEPSFKDRIFGFLDVFKENGEASDVVKRASMKTSEVVHDVERYFVPKNEEKGGLDDDEASENVDESVEQSSKVSEDAVGESDETEGGDNHIKLLGLARRWKVEDANVVKKRRQISRAKYRGPRQGGDRRVDKVELVGRPAFKKKKNKKVHPKTQNTNNRRHLEEYDVGVHNYHDPDVEVTHHGYHHHDIDDNAIRKAHHHLDDIDDVVVQDIRHDDIDDDVVHDVPHDDIDEDLINAPHDDIDEDIVHGVPHDHIDEDVIHAPHDDIDEHVVHGVPHDDIDEHVVHGVPHDDIDEDVIQAPHDDIDDHVVHNTHHNGDDIIYDVHHYDAEDGVIPFEPIEMDEIEEATNDDDLPELVLEELQEVQKSLVEKPVANCEENTLLDAHIKVGSDLSNLLKEIIQPGEKKIRIYGKNGEQGTSDIRWKVDEVL